MSKNKGLEIDYKAVGKRLRDVRLNLRYSRPDLKRKYDIPVSTLQNWEDARFPITESGLLRMIDIYHQEGIECTKEWLFFGTGEPPHSSSQNSEKLTNTLEPLTELEIIQKELQAFHHSYPGAIDMIVSDDSMLPALKLGDTVAGIRFFGKDMAAKGANQICIVQPKEGMMTAKLVEKGNKENTFNLYTIFPSKTLYYGNIELFSIAPVCWIRRDSLISKK